MVGGYDDLVRRPGMVEDNAIARTARRRLVLFVADVAGPDTQLAESSGYSPREQFIEEQPA
jgi:hypothetical protein